MAWNIVQHAFRMVFGNLTEALKASVVPFLILIAIIVLLSKVTGLQMLSAPLELGGPEMAGPALLFVFTALGAGLIIFAWVAVTWHRFILLEEYPEVIPKITGRPVGAYVRRMLMVVLQLMALMVPLMFLFFPFLGSMLANPVLNLVISLLLAVLLSFFWLRICVSLPSVALGAHMGSVEAWRETSKVWEMILGVSAIIVGLNFAAEIITTALFSGIPIVSSLLMLAVQWVSMMVGVSILTTLYGHVIEGRSLAD